MITGTNTSNKTSIRWNKKRARKEPLGDRTLNLHLAVEDKDQNKKTRFNTNKRHGLFLKIRKVHPLNNNLVKKNHSQRTTLKEVKDMKRNKRNIKSKSIKRTSTNIEKKKNKKKMNKVIPK